MKTKQFLAVKLFTFIACMFWTLNSTAEEVDSFFSCPQAMHDKDELIAIKKANKNSTKKWNNAILEYHPLEDENIRYSYIIEARDTFNIKTMMNNTRAWFGSVTSSELASVKNVDNENCIIEATTSMNNIGQASGYGSISVVGAIFNFRISFKNNKIKFDIWVSHYHIGTASNFAKNKSEVVPIAKSYPIDPKGKHKSSLGMAFININIYSIGFALDYLEYMNKHHDEDLKSKKESW